LSLRGLGRKPPAGTPNTGQIAKVVEIAVYEAFKGLKKSVRKKPKKIKKNLIIIATWVLTFLCEIGKFGLVKQSR
jgi:hypothetical protein